MKKIISWLGFLLIIGYINPFGIAVAITLDTTPPTLTYLSFSKDEVDTTTAPDTIIVTAKFTDNTDVIGNFVISFTGPGGYTIGADTPFGTGNCRVAGIVNGEATCVTTVVFPHNTPPFLPSAPSGTWMAYVGVIDASGNGRSYDSSQLSAAGFPSEVEVTTND